MSNKCFLTLVEAIALLLSEVDYILRPRMYGQKGTHMTHVSKDNYISLAYSTYNPAHTKSLVSEKVIRTVPHGLYR